MIDEFRRPSILSRIKDALIRLLEKLPLILILGIILFQFTFIVAKSFDKKLKNRLRPYEGPPLVGMLIDVPRKKPAWSMAKLMSGTWQKEFEIWFNFRVPFRPFLIRIHNQIYYTFFSKSYMYNGGIVVGQNNYLYELAYLLKYCNSNGTQFHQDEVTKWVEQLETFSNFFNKRGQTFIYLITPSKVAYFPEYIPLGFNCSAERRKEYTLMTTALKKSHVRVIDGADFVVRSKTKFKDAMFPQGGTHWTSLAAVLTTQQLVNEISNARKLSLPALRFSSKISYQPVGTDADLITLTNLLYPHLDYLVPTISVGKVKPKYRKPLKIAIIGGSFTDPVASILNDSKMFQQIDAFRYLILGHLRYSANAPTQSFPIKKDSIDSYKDILNADIIILEENEANLRSNHFRVLTDLILNKNILKLSAI